MGQKYEVNNRVSAYFQSYTLRNYYLNVIPRSIKEALNFTQKYSYELVALNHLVKLTGYTVECWDKFCTVLKEHGDFLTNP